jgi:hypothetical protein
MFLLLLLLSIAQLQQPREVVYLQSFDNLSNNLPLIGDGSFGGSDGTIMPAIIDQQLNLVNSTAGIICCYRNFESRSQDVSLFITSPPFFFFFFFFCSILLVSWTAFYLPPLQCGSSGWNITYKATVLATDRLNLPGDGFSFSWGPLPLKLDTFAPLMFEDGFVPTSSGNRPLAFGFHMLANEAGILANGKDWNNGRSSNTGANEFSAWFDSFTDNLGRLDLVVFHSWDASSGRARFVVNCSQVPQTSLDISATYAPLQSMNSDSFLFAFAARTGGRTLTTLIDDIRLNAKCSTPLPQRQFPNLIAYYPLDDDARCSIVQNPTLT